MQCPYCGAENPEIVARHDYTIEYSEEQGKWIKNVGDVTYSCGNCTDILSVSDIEGVLKQVDEL